MSGAPAHLSQRQPLARSFFVFFNTHLILNRPPQG